MGNFLILYIFGEFAQFAEEFKAEAIYFLGGKWLAFYQSFAGLDKFFMNAVFSRVSVFMQDFFRFL